MGGSDLKKQKQTKKRFLTEKYSYIQNILTSCRTGLLAEKCQ